MPPIGAISSAISSSSGILGVCAFAKNLSAAERGGSRKWNSGASVGLSINNFLARKLPPLRNSTGLGWKLFVMKWASVDHFLHQ